MAKTANTIRTRSIAEIADEFALVSDTGFVRFAQCRLANEFVGGEVEGREEKKQRGERKKQFATEVNSRLVSRGEKEVSNPAVDHMLSTWSYLRRANLDVSTTVVVDDNGHEQHVPNSDTIVDVTKAAFTFASQGIAEKEAKFVKPLLESIRKGADPKEAFKAATKAIAVAKKDAADKKDTANPNDGTKKDEEISFDAIVASIAMLKSENMTLDAAQKATLRDLFAEVAPLIAE